MPKRLVLPFGYVITFKYLTASEMEDEDIEDADGGWDVGTRTIYIRRRLPAKRLRYVIGHEMDHAINDYRHHLEDQGIAKS